MFTFRASGQYIPLINRTCQWPIVRLAQLNVPLINGTFDRSMGNIDHWHGTFI